jgi:acyl-CoA reductase-like NAD-dependent aldehyde dehydrogenase
VHRTWRKRLRGHPTLCGSEEHCVHSDARGLVRHSYSLERRMLTLSCSQANGQNCIGIERFLVHRSKYQEFLDIMTPRVQKLRCGPVLSSPAASVDKSIKTVDCGAMISSRLAGQLEDMLAKAEKGGARIVVGGKRHRHPDWPEGHYFQPTLIADVTPEMDVAKHERESFFQHLLLAARCSRTVRIVFAPVMNVIPYDTVDEAIKIANGTRYGLGSAVFGNDRDECRFVAERLDVGMVAINE